MKATLTFLRRQQSVDFGIAWGRYSKTGYTVGSGTLNVTVEVYDVTEDDKVWIDNYIRGVEEDITSL